MQNNLVKVRLRVWKEILRLAGVTDLSQWPCGQSGQGMRKPRLMTLKLDLNRMKMEICRNSRSLNQLRVLDNFIYHQALIISLKVKLLGSDLKNTSKRLCTKKKFKREDKRRSVSIDSERQHERIH